MANNTIQIKRSSTVATPGTLANGELAFSSLTNVLMIGSPTATNTPIYIGGLRNPGILTANHALVANSLSQIDFINTANAIIRTLTANNALSTPGQVLTGNSTGGIYWSTVASGSATAAGLDTQIQFNNGGSAFGGTAGFTFTTGTNNVFIANTLTVGTTVVNTTALLLSGGLAITNGVSINTISIGVGNTSANAVHSYNAFSLANSTATVNMSPTSIIVGGAAITTTPTFSILNTTGNTVINSTSYVINGGITAVSNGFNLSVLPSGASTLSIGNSSVSTTITGGDASLRNLSVTGNLSVIGSLVTINVATLQVNDPLIQLAANNITTDLVDIGLYGVYGPTPTYTALYRKNTGGNWFLLDGITSAPTTTVGSGSRAILDAHLNAGAQFVANATQVNITATGSVSSFIVANTLSLTTALPATSGGTGTGTYAVGDLLYASTTTALARLAVGTSGQVLQMNTGGLAGFQTLDGGVF